jgi:hypothetical protein
MITRRTTVALLSMLVLMVLLWVFQEHPSIEGASPGGLAPITVVPHPSMLPHDAALGRGDEHRSGAESSTSAVTGDGTGGDDSSPLSATAASGTQELALDAQLEGNGRVIPFATGHCHCLPPSSPTDGRWVSDTLWEPAPSTEATHGSFVNVSAALDRLLNKRRLRDSNGGAGISAPQLRMLLIGDSITRYMMCFLASSVAAELNIDGLAGCEPERSRGAHFQLWPATPAHRAQSPIVLQFVSDFYFPESHVAQDLSLMEAEEASWMPRSPDVVVVSRGTWDAWIRMPRASAGKHLIEGLTAGLVYMRRKYPDAEIIVYGLSEQYPARYHKHSERCAMQTSALQVRSLVYCSARRANYEIDALSPVANTTPSEKSLTRVKYIDFFPMTHHDKNWAANTMNSDGMHYVGIHEPWFAKYMWRLVHLAAASPELESDREFLEKSTPLPLDPAQCDESTLALNTMPRQKKLRNPAKAKGSKAKRDCGLWLADRQQLLDFHKSFHRLHWKNITPAIQYSDCVFYHKASAQRLGGVDLHWPSPHTEAINTVEGVDLKNRVLPLRTPLWSRWKRNSEFCRNVERSLTAADIREMDRHIDNGVVPCGHRLVFTLRATNDTRAALQLPSLLRQRCDMVRGKRDL